MNSKKKPVVKSVSTKPKKRSAINASPQPGLPIAETERKQTEDLLEASESKYRNLIETAGTGVATIDIEGKLVIVNQAICELFGYSKEELVGKPFALFLHPDDTGKMLEIFQSAPEQPSGPPHVEFRGVHRDGHTVHCYSNPTILWHKDRVIGFNAIVFDITERKRAEEALRDSEHRVSEALEFNRKILDTSSIGILTYKKSGQCTSANAAAARAAGATVAQLLAQNFHEIPSWKKSGMYQAALRALDTDIEQLLKAHLVTTFGKDVWLSFSFSSFDSAGERHLLVFTSDVSERKQADEARQQSEEKYHMLVENLGEGIGLVNSEEQFTYANKAAEDLFGVLPGSLLGRTLYEFILPKQAGVIREQTHERRVGKTSVYEIEISRPDGEKRNLLITAVPQFDDQGEFMGTFGVFRDITKRKQAEEALRDSEHRVSEALEFNRKILNTSSIGILTYKESGQCVSANAAAARVTGGTVAQLLAQNFHEILSWKKSGIDQVATRVLDTGIEQFSEVQHVTTFGKDVWLSFNFWSFDSADERNLLVFVSDITERKRAEARIAYQANLLAQVNDAIVASDEQYRLTAWNLAAEAMYGWRAEEVLGHDGLEIVRTEWVSADPGEMRQMIAETGHWHGEATQALKDGTRIPVEMSSLVLRDDSGQITGYVSVNRDITERKQAEIVLQESRQLLETTLASLRDAVFTIDAKTVEIIDCNPAASAIFGYSRQEMLNRTTTFLHVDQATLEVFREHLNQSVKEKGFLFMPEFRMKRKDGTLFPSEHSVVPLENEQGMRIGWVSVVRDITERKQAEEDIKSLAKFPSENPNPILRIGQDGTLLYMNVAGSSQLPDWHLQVGQAVPTMLKEAVVKSMKNGTIQLINLEYGERILSFSVAPIGATDYANLYGLDITERKRAEAELAQSHEQLRALTHYWQNTIEAERAHISHEIHDDFGQSMTALKMDLTWLANRLPEGDEKVDRIRGMTTLVDESIALMRRIATNLRPGLLDDLGLNAALEWQAQEFSRHSGIPCKLNLPKDDLRLDPVLNTTLFRIFQETLTNIARHAQATRVSASLKQKEQTLVLTIRDNGRGITEDELTNPSSLGLLGLRERATQWKGEATIRGAPGKGTTVTIRIPLPAQTANGGKP